MCNAAVIQDSCGLEFVADHLKTQEMCDKAVMEDPSFLEYVCDWFVTQLQIGRWHDGSEYYDCDEITEWYAGYQKRKAQRGQIKEELLPTAWHPSRWRDWCVSEDEKKETEKLWK